MTGRIQDMAYLKAILFDESPTVLNLSLSTTGKGSEKKAVLGCSFMSSVTISFKSALHLYLFLLLKVNEGSYKYILRM